MDGNLKTSNFSPLLDKFFGWLRPVAISKYILKKLNSLIARLFFHGWDQNKIHMIACKNVITKFIGVLNLNDLNTTFKLKMA